MSVTVNISEVRATVARAERELGRVDAILLGWAIVGAEQLRATDHYQDRTTDLRTGTQGKSVTDGDPAEAVMIMDTEYASYVVARGFSNFDEVGQQIEERISQSFDDLERSIAG